MGLGAAGAATVLLWTSLASGARINSYAGPFEIIFKEALQCAKGTVSEPLVMNMTGVMHYSRSSGKVYVGEVNLDAKMTQGEYGVKLALAKWDSVAGWRDNFFHMDGGEFCQVAKTIGKQVLQEIHRQIPGIPSHCPFATGHYPIPGFNISGALSRYDHFPVFPYGRYRGDLAFYNMKSKKTHGCISGISEVVPKILKI